MRVLIVLAILVAYVSAHSFLLCFDNGGLGVKQLTLASGKNPCRSYPRSRALYDSESDGFTNRPGSVCRTGFGASYPANYPAATIAPGAKFYPEWPARNHAGQGNAGNVQFFLSPVNPTADPSQATFNQNLICDISYSNCNLDLGSNDAPCTGECTIPASTAPGKYIVQWWWEFNPGELYSTCADITVSGTPIPTTVAASTATSATSASTSGTTASTSGTVASTSGTVATTSRTTTSISGTNTPTPGTASSSGSASKNQAPIACASDANCPSKICKIDGFCHPNKSSGGIGPGGVAAVVFALLFVAAAGVIVAGYIVLIHNKKI